MPQKLWAVRALPRIIGELTALPEIPGWWKGARPLPRNATPALGTTGFGFWPWPPHCFFDKWNTERNRTRVAVLTAAIIAVVSTATLVVSQVWCSYMYLKYALNAFVN